MFRKTLVTFALVATACGGSNATTTTADEDTQAASGETSGEETAEPTVASSARDVCVTAMTRERECQEEFVPALVALRVRLDMPAGIAEQAETDQDALLAQAREEYANDSTDEAIDANCAQLDELPAEQTDPIVETETACLEAADCAAFVECQIAFHESRFTGAS